MRVQLLYPRVLGGKLYPKGQHEVPDKLKADWFVKALLKSGDMSVLTDLPEEEKDFDDEAEEALLVKKKFAAKK